MFSYTSNFLKINGIKIHCYRTGGNKPALVLAHGISDDGLCWTPVADALADNFDVIMMDARGHGLSDGPVRGYSLKEMAEDLAGLINGLELNQPFILGHSMGAITVLALATMYPQIAKAILLEDPPASWMSSQIQKKSKKTGNGLKEWLISNKRKTCADLFAEVKSNPTWQEAEIEPWINSKHRYSINILKILNRNDADDLNDPVLFKRVSCPVLFLEGDQALGAICSDIEVNQLKSLIPQLQVAKIQGAGHSIRRDKFVEYMQAVNSFLHQVH